MGRVAALQLIVSRLHTTSQAIAFVSSQACALLGLLISLTVSTQSLTTALLDQIGVRRPPCGSYEHFRTLCRPGCGTAFARIINDFQLIAALRGAATRSSCRTACSCRGACIARPATPLATVFVFVCRHCSCSTNIRRGTKGQYTAPPLPVDRRRSAACRVRLACRDLLWWDATPVWSVYN
jgi:hypothetical protein